MVWNGLRYFVFCLPIRRFFWVMLISIIVITELYFGWIEYLVGQCLLSGNANRPESGFVWEMERKKQIANDQLAKLVNSRFSIQNGSVSFAHLLVSLTEGRGVMISYAHFMDLYRQLPVPIASKMFSPYLILKASSERAWDRTYFEKKDNKINICLLDANNIILEQNDIAQETIDFTSMTRPNFNGSIDNLSDFADKIYSADVFFSALLLLPYEIQNKVISSPEKLLNVDGDLLRVGISYGIQSGTNEIGVEIEDAQGCHVIFFKGQSRAVENIISELDKQSEPLNLLRFDSNCSVKR